MNNRNAILRVAVPLVLAASSSGLGLSAYAAPPQPAPAGAAVKPKAAEFVRSGEAKYNASDYAGALADFVASDEQTPSVEVARYIGLCQDKLGQYRAAAASYNRFLAHPPPKLVDQVGPLVVRVREIEQMPGTVRIDAVPSGASLAIDGAPERNTAPYEAHLTPGKHIVRASAPDHEALEREVNVTFASAQDVTLTLSATPPPAPAVPAPVPPPAPAPLPQIVVLPTVPPPVVTRRMVAFAAAGVAVLGAGLAATFGALALNNKSSYQSNPTLSNSDNGNNDAAYADGAIALAVAAGVTSLVLFATDETIAPSSAAAPPARGGSVAVAASPFLTPHGGGAGALLRF